MKALVLSILIACTLTAFGQTANELKLEIEETKNDSLRAMLYGKLAMQYRRSNPDSAFHFIGKGLTVAKRIDNPTCLASMYNGFGNIHFFQSNYDSCIHYYSACLRISQELADSARMGAMYNNIGLVYSYKTEYDTAIEILHKAYRIREQLADESITSTVNNLGIVYQKMDAWEKALEYYKEAADLKEKYNQRLSLSNTLNNIGIALNHLGRYREAIQYYEQSLEIAIEFGDKIKEANAHNNLASVLHDIPDMLNMAGEHYRKSISLKEQMGDKAGLANSYANYAEWLMDTNNPAEALKFINKSEQLDNELGKNLYSAKIMRFKGEIYRALGRYKEAYEAMNTAYSTREDELSEDLNNKVADLEVAFETHRKESEITRLSLKNELQAANLAKSRNAIYAIGVAAAMSILVLAVYFNQRHKKMKIEREAQELQIEALKKRLIDLNISPSEPEVSIGDLNKKINTPLSDREFEVLRLTLEGKSNNEIADELSVSTSTVKFHLRNTYGKLGVNNRKEALDYVVKAN